MDVRSFLRNNAKPFGSIVSAINLKGIPSEGEIRLSQEILYNAPQRSALQGKGVDLKKALEKIVNDLPAAERERLAAAFKKIGGPLPLENSAQGVDAMPIHDRRVVIMDTMQIYDRRVVDWFDYCYPRMDRLIHQGHAPFLFEMMRDAIVIEFGIGNKQGAAKTGDLIKSMPADIQPVGFIGVDQLKDNEKPARNAIVGPGCPRERFEWVTGDIFEEETYRAINEKIERIIWTARLENAPVVVLLQSPTYNDFSDGQTELLHKYVFDKLISPYVNDIIFCIAIDNTTDLELLDRIYNNPVTRQFALVAVAHWCWSNDQPFEPLKARSIVVIGPDEEGCITIQHVVEEGARRFVIVPAIRKFPEDVLRKKFAGMNTTILGRMSCKMEEFPTANYAFYPSRATNGAGVFKLE